MTSSTTIRFDDPAALASWHDTLAVLRRDDPVHWDQGLQAWIVTRYSDVSAGLYNSDRFSARAPHTFMGYLSTEQLEPLAALRDFYDRWMVFSDDPYHHTVRQCVARILAPRAVERRRSQVARDIRDLVERSADRPIDLYHDLARPIAVRAICDLLEIPVDLWKSFSTWSSDMIAFISTTTPDPARGRQALESYLHSVEYVRAAAGRLAASGRSDNPLMAVAELGEPAMVATFAQFLTGGCDPIAASIGNGLSSLLSHPQEYGRLRRGELRTASVIEECVRFETPFTQVPKVARQAVEVAGTEIPAGDQVRFMISAANRDPEVFDSPDEFDGGRAPNPHLGYGKGPHYCIGAGLARLELNEVFALIADDRFAWCLEGAPTWLNSFGLRCVDSLPGQITIAG